MSPTRERIERLLEQRAELWRALRVDPFADHLRDERQALERELAHLWPVVRDERLGVVLHCTSCGCNVTRDEMHDVGGLHERRTFLRRGDKDSRLLLRLCRQLSPA